MIQRVCTSWRGSIVSRGLICEISEGERVWVEEGRCEPPWFILRPGGWVEIFDLFVAEAVMSVGAILVGFWQNKFLAPRKILAHMGKRMGRLFAYLSGCGPPAIASPSEASPELDPACVVAVPTSGKFWRKFAMNSSPGFCEDVLRHKSC